MIHFLVSGAIVCLPAVEVGALIVDEKTLKNIERWAQDCNLLHQENLLVYN